MEHVAGAEPADSKGQAGSVNTDVLKPTWPGPTFAYDLHWPVTLGRLMLPERSKGGRGAR